MAKRQYTRGVDQLADDERRFVERAVQLGNATAAAREVWPDARHAQSKGRNTMRLPAAQKLRAELEAARDPLAPKMKAPSTRYRGGEDRELSWKKRRSCSTT